MITKEIYILTKYGKFNAEYIEKIPIWKRRYYLYLLNEDIEKQNKEIEKIKS